MKKRAHKYWICGKCAEKKGLIPPNYAVTCINGLCGNCKRKDETTLVPITDYSDPKTGRKAIWD